MKEYVNGERETIVTAPRSVGNDGGNSLPRRDQLGWLGAEGRISVITEV